VCTQAEENLTQNSKIILYVEQFHNQTCVMLMLKVLNLGAFVILGLGTLNLYFKIIIIVSLDFFFFFLLEMGSRCYPSWSFFIPSFGSTGV
jgi:hypothetical protein